MSNVGFTGTRSGCTPAQLTALQELLCSLSMRRFHHGRCVGADTQAHEIVRLRKPNVKIVVHPSTTTDRQSAVIGDIVWPVRLPLERNKDIVRASHRLVACPSMMEEEQRSGTWATMRFAYRKRKPIIVVWPDGTVRRLKAGEWVNRNFERETHGD